MPSRSPPRRSPRSTRTARAKTKTRTHQRGSGNQQGLDAETKTSDSPVQGELFLLTSPFIERSEKHRLWLPAYRFRQVKRIDLTLGQTAHDGAPRPHTHDFASRCPP